MECPEDDSDSSVLAGKEKLATPTQLPLPQSEDTGQQFPQLPVIQSCSEGLHVRPLQPTGLPGPRLLGLSHLSATQAPRVSGLPGTLGLCVHQVPLPALVLSKPWQFWLWAVPTTPSQQGTVGTARGGGSPRPHTGREVTSCGCVEPEIVTWF